MHFSAIALTLFGVIASASASSLYARQDLPSCVQICAASADLDGCSSTDAKCLCNSSKFVQSTTTCVFSTCKGDDLQKALQASQENCLKVGVTLTSTPPATQTQTSPASSSTASNSTSANTTAPPSPSNTAGSGAMSTGANAFVGLLAAGLVAITL